MQLRWLAASVLIACLATPLGCATRESRTTVFERSGVTVFLREHKQGFAVLERELQHPVQISTKRLEYILSALEIRGRQENLSGIRAAFEPSQVPVIAQALQQALGAASPNQEVGVQIIIKKTQNLIFDRKRLSSFVAYVKDDLLYLHVSRVDWEIPDRVQKTALPIPRVGDHPMRFKVVPSEGMYQEGVYGVSVEWASPVFSRPVRRVKAQDDRRERTILMESPIAPSERDARAIPADLLPQLSSDDLRALADLEDARDAGSITEGHYRREREKVLRAAEKARNAQEGATSR